MFWRNVLKFLFSPGSMSSLLNCQSLLIKSITHTKWLQNQIFLESDNFYVKSTIPHKMSYFLEILRIQKWRCLLKCSSLRTAFTISCNLSKKANNNNNFIFSRIKYANFYCGGESHIYTYTNTIKQKHTLTRTYTYKVNPSQI